MFGLTLGQLLPPRRKAGYLRPAAHNDGREVTQKRSDRASPPIDDPAGLDALARVNPGHNIPQDADRYTVEPEALRVEALHDHVPSAHRNDTNPLPAAGRLDDLTHSVGEPRANIGPRGHRKERISGQVDPRGPDPFVAPSRENLGGEPSGHEPAIEDELGVRATAPTSERSR